MCTPLAASIKLQANDDTYKNQKIYDKGHLLPVAIYSFDDNYNYAQSTFTYTNAVPQKHLFNIGAWASYEKAVRGYASTTCGKNGGALHVITGVTMLAEYGVGITHPTNFRGIRVPKAMWTAGCCIVSGGVQLFSNFAVVGNNRGVIKIKEKVTELTVQELQDFILEDVKASSSLALGIQLFPGKAQCSDDKNYVTLSSLKRKAAKSAEGEQLPGKKVKPSDGW